MSELRTWDEGKRCAACCNGDRCDDPTHFDRNRCPLCRSTGWAIWTAEGKANYAEHRGWDSYREVPLPGVAAVQKPTVKEEKRVPARIRSKRRVFIDMDGVIVDFEGRMLETGMKSEEFKKLQGSYASMKPIPGAIEAVNSIVGMGYEVWIATKPPTGVAHAYAEKAAWVLEHLPFLKRRIIITHNKGLLGDHRDFLLDDRPHKASCRDFQGSLLGFVDGYHWKEALEVLRHCSRMDKKDRLTYSEPVTRTYTWTVAK